MKLFPGITKIEQILNWIIAINILVIFLSQMTKMTKAEI